MATNTEQFLDLLVAASQNPTNDGVKDRAVVILDKLLNLLIKEDGTDSPLADVGTGLPNTDITVDAYRTAKLGIGEATPEELLDVVGTEVGATGGVKFDYTWTSGAISRVQFAGQNVLSEIGVPAGLVEANLFDFFGVGNQSDMRAFLYNGNVNAVSGASGNLSVGAGVQALSTTHNTSFSVFPNNNGDSAIMVARIINSSPDTGYVYASAFQVSSTAAYNLEPAFRIDVNSTVSSVVSNYHFSPHFAELPRGLRLEQIADGTMIPGFVYADQNTITIGVAAKSVAVDAAGHAVGMSGAWTGDTAPATAAADGEEGETRVVGNFVYKYAAGAWTRAALTFATW